MNVKYSEIFHSFQGEAELAGKPSVWLRFFGCNLECNGFGQTNPADENTWDLPYKNLDVDKFKSVDELPVFDKGCDSSYSWSSKYKHLCPSVSVKEVCDKLEEQLPTGKFAPTFSGQTDTQLCFTGGEPMLRQKQIIAIMEELDSRGNIPQTVTVETNATRLLSDELKAYIETYSCRDDNRWHWSMSPKILHTSGEVDAVKPDVISQYWDVEGNVSAILKFVCNGSKESWDEIEKALDDIDSAIYDTEFPDVWIMPAGATKEAQEDVVSIVQETMRRGYQVATRNHAYVFGNQIGT